MVPGHTFVNSSRHVTWKVVPKFWLDKHFFSHQRDILSQYLFSPNLFVQGNVPVEPNNEDTTKLSTLGVISTAYIKHKRHRSTTSSTGTGTKCYSYSKLRISVVKRGEISALRPSLLPQHQPNTVGWPTVSSTGTTLLPSP